MKQSGPCPYWHVHHEIPLEWCYNYDERVKYIRTHKPSNEQDLRLRLLQPVRGQLPQELVEAGEAYDEARKAYDEVGKSHSEAEEALYEARKARHNVADWKIFSKARKSHREARSALREARSAWNEASKAWNEAFKAYFEVLSRHKDEIEALHSQECFDDCPWNGKTIFPAA